ncbi:MAG TPA: winged helix DNA-binding domain-containing protein [Candidatus Limnocylindria bacterium]|nr:winged helix DNA-binding domain-containing protein [Candidatus Limnocylindria bacterium]
MPARRSSDLPILTLRELNRALLARQMLLRRDRVDPTSAIERLGALQAQWPRAPYVGLWSRLERFDRADLEDALRRRRVVKATLMRGTLHLASASDYPYYAIAAREARRLLWAATERRFVAFFATQLPAVRAFAKHGRAAIADPEKLHERLIRYTRTPRSREDLIAFIAREADVPHELATHLVWGFVAAHGMLVHTPDSAHFAADRAGELVAASVALPRMKVPPFPDAVRHTVTRHLAAFGPATVEDISSWTSIRTPPIREALAALGSRVRRFADERGRVLHDLGDAPRPGPDTAAPVRFLPKWDSTLLAYTPAERVRILPERHRAAVIAKNGDVSQTILVDGVVAGTWAITRTSRQAVVTVTPFGRLSRADRAALADEGERLARFLAPDLTSHALHVA